MGVRTAVSLFVAAVLAAPAQAGITEGARYLEDRRQDDGGFAEPGTRSDPGLTAWVVLGLAAAGRPPEGAADYLAGKPYPAATDLELRILALDALGEDVSGLVKRLEALRRPGGGIGPTLNSTVWGVLALRAAGKPARAATLSYLVRHQRPDGGWGWQPGIAPDSNDTAAAVQALRAAGVGARSRPIRRGLAYLRGLQNADGGFELTPGRGSDAPSTAWAIQAFLAAGREPGRAAFAYLERLQRADGSFSYRTGTVSNPVWTTAQGLAALARKPFPLGE